MKCMTPSAVLASMSSLTSYTDMQCIYHDNNKKKKTKGMRIIKYFFFLASIVSSKK